MKKRVLGLVLAAVIALTAFVPALVSADGMNIIGIVTITNQNNVNIRGGGSTDFPIVGSAAPGQQFPCTGFASSGWYEIILPDNTIGYVSNNLSSLSYYTTPVPWGGGTTNVQGNVLVQYVSNAGQALFSEYVRVSFGTNYVSANDTRVPQGYVLSSPRTAAVTVNAQGVVSPAAIQFVYAPAVTPAPTQPPVQYATVPVYYKDLYGTLLNTDYAYLGVGSRLISADNAKVPWDYTLVGAKDAVVSVSAQGVASPSSVTFLYARQSTPVPTPAQANAVVPVYYRTNTGTLLNTAYVTAVPGSNTITANNALVPAG